MVKLDISKYLSEGELNLEKLNLENCLITDINCKYLEISDCTFKNIVFENSFRDVSGSVRNCTFVDCGFRDSFVGDELEFSFDDCRLTHCIFENIIFKAYMMQSEVVNCKLTDCILKNINIEGDVSIFDMEIREGEMKKVSFNGSQLINNSLIDVNMEDVSIQSYMSENHMQNIAFKNTVVKGYIGKNTLSNCDKQGITIIDERF